MSVATEINRIKSAVAASYAAAGAKGATMPSVENVGNLAATIASITGGGGGLQGHRVSLYLDTGASSSSSLGARGVVIKSDRTYVSFQKLAAPTSNPVLIGTFDDCVAVITSGKMDNDPVGFMRGDNTVIIHFTSLTPQGVWNASDVFCGLPTADTSIYILTYGMCLLGGTLVTLEDGSTKPIECITYDDDLLVWDFDRGCLSSAKPAWIKRGENGTHYWNNVFASGRTVQTTGEVYGHRFFDTTKKLFVPNTECAVGFGEDCKEDRLVSCTRVEGSCEFYNIITAGHFNLFANGILTSCRLNNLYPVNEMKFVKDGRVLRPAEDFAGLERWIEPLRLREQAEGTEALRSYVRNLEQTEMR